MTASERLFERLRAAFPESSARSLRKWLEAGRVQVNQGVVRDGRTPVAPDARIALAGHGRPAFPSALRLVHEDPDLLVVDKPPGLLTIATEHERDRTAYRLLREYLAGGHPPGRPFVVHRLDRETSGLVVFATSPAVKRHLQSQFEARAVARIYVAVVEGRVEADRGTLDSWLSQDRALRVRVARGAPPGARGRAKSRRGITHYTVRERRRDATVLELRLDTGRRHQIRVQLAHLGHPIVGDPVHGTRRDPVGRLCLHAVRLGFVHPGTGRRVGFESPAPAVFRRVGT